MAKEMMSARIDADLRDALSAEARSERRTVSNMLEWVLRERYSALVAGAASAGGVPVARAAVATGRGGETSSTLAPITAPATSAESVPPTVQTASRRHYQAGRVARVECESLRFVDGKCEMCGAAGP